MVKTDVPIPVFHAELDSSLQIDPKPTQNPILTKFSKNPIFIKIAENRWAAAPAGGPLKPDFLTCFLLITLSWIA